MEFEVVQDGETKAQGTAVKGKMLVLRVNDGEAWLQLEISEREFRLAGDGGTGRRRTWECEVAIPRSGER